MNDLKEIGGFIVSADPYVNHDNSLSGNGTLTSPLGVVPGYNETVIFSGNSSTATCSEAPSGFDSIKIYYDRGSDSFVQEYPGQPTDNIIQLYCGGAFTNGFVSLFNFRYSVNNNVISPTDYLKETFGNSTLSIRNASAPSIKKVVGINRKQ